MKYIITLLGVIAMFLACSDSGSSAGTQESLVSTDDARSIGRKVSTHAQATLGSQLMQAISERDAAYAVRFCNLSVSPMIDSINQANNCTVQRLTSRRRNPANKFETMLDKIAWNAFRTHQVNEGFGDTVLTSGSTPTYYRPIFIASALCLQCHGSRSTEIELATLEAIDSLYPADAAVNYVPGDLRGMWKITFGGTSE